MGSLVGFTAGFTCSRRRTGVSDCVLGSTVRDISGSNPSCSTRKSGRGAEEGI